MLNWCSQFNTYRVRLLTQGIIHQVAHGRVDFTLPYPREYLREHAAGYNIGLPLGQSEP